MITEIRVRKQITDADLPRYRTEIGPKNITQKDLESFEAVRFRYSPNMTERDIKDFRDKWSFRLRNINIVEEN